MLKEDESLSPLQKSAKNEVSLLMEMWLIFRRALTCQLRNPMDVTLKVVQSIFTAAIVIIVFGNVNFI